MSTAKKNIITSDENASFAARVESLKLAKNWTWETVAQKLQVTRMTLHLIKKEKSGVSKRNLYRLEQLEIQEGIRPPGAIELVEAMVSRFEEMKNHLKPADFDRGYVEIAIEYARGEPQKGYPSKIKLERPPVKSAGTLIADLLADEGYQKVALKCIRPSKWANQKFLNMLTPFSYQTITETAMGLVFGINWREKFSNAPLSRE